jgi:hypothetical protein
MRKLFAVIVVAVVCFGCEPQIIYFNVQPSSVAAGPASVTLNWKISVGDGEISADQPVMPKLNPAQKVNNQGSMQVQQVCKTTTFKLALPYGGERTAKVNVAQPCGSNCGDQHLTFTGSCPSALQGPVYGTQTVNAAVAPGNLMNLVSDASFPIHVSHAGQDIALSAFGGPIGALPTVPAAGDYIISVPGQVGLNVCANAPSPVGGGTAEAPVVHLTVTPTCPMP